MNRLLLLAAATSAGALLLALQHTAGSVGPEAASGIPAQTQQVADQPGQAAAAASTTAVQPDPTPGEPGRQLELPDGSKVPPLNGVDRPAMLPWPPHRAWSPIVGKETDEDGLQWYVHADGSNTTTRMAWHPQLGRPDPITIVLNPVATQPLPTLPVPPSPRNPQ